MKRIQWISALAASPASVDAARRRELSPTKRSVVSSLGPSSAGSPGITRETAILWCILAVTALVYLRSLANGFILDDPTMFAKNADIRNWSFLWKAFTRNEFWYSDAGFLQIQQYKNYRPLFLVWCWLDYHLFGLNPAPWHASILPVYLLVVWLVFKISRRLAGDSTSALLAAAAFGLTPIHTAAVTWVAATCYVLGAALGLAAFYLVIMRREDAGRRNWAAIALYAGALLCHESLTAFPALVACYAFFFNPNDSEAGETAESSGAMLWIRARRAIIWMEPFAIELAIYFVVRRLLMGFFVGNPYYFINLLSDAQAVLTVPLVFATYLTMLAMPWLTLPNHRVIPVSSASSPDFWVPLAAIALVGAALVVVERRDPRRPLHLFCAAWMAVTLAPMMVLHQMPHLVQDYYLFLPSVGWCILLGDLIASVAHTNALARRLALGGAIAMLVVYAVALWRVQPYWHDDVAIAKGFVEGFPESVEWHWNLADDLHKQGDMAQAEKEIRTALSLEPDRTGTVHPHSASLHHFLGELLASRGDIEGARLEFAKSLNDPPDEDETHPSRAPIWHSEDGIALYARGLRDARSGHTNESIQEVARGLDMMKGLPVPDYGPLPMLYIKLAELYDSVGKQAQVEAVLKEVDSMTAGELAVGLARARIRLNHSDKQGAERILLELSDRYPDDAKVLIPLGDLQLELKQNQQALISYQKAGAGWYAGADVHSRMAKTLHAMGRDREALLQCQLTDAMGSRDWASQFTCAEIREAIQSKSN